MGTIQLGTDFALFRRTYKIPRIFQTITLEQISWRSDEDASLRFCCCDSIFAGCTDQETANGPFSARGGTESQSTKPSPLPIFDINAIVIDHLTNSQYHLVGHIDYTFTDTNGDYSFARRGKFSITDIDHGGTCQFLTSEFSKGKASGTDPANVIDNYSLDQTFPGVSLSVRFIPSDGVSLEGVDIETKADITTK